MVTDMISTRAATNGRAKYDPLPGCCGAKGYCQQIITSDSLLEMTKLACKFFQPFFVFSRALSPLKGKNEVTQHIRSTLQRFILIQV